MTIIDDHDETDEDESISRRPSTAPRAGGTRPACPASARRTSRTRCAGSRGMLGPMWIVLVHRVRDRGRERDAQRLRAARARPRHRHHRPRRAHRTTWTSARCTTCCCQALALYAASSLLSIIAAYMLAGVIQRLMFKLRSDVEDKVNVLPLSYIDKQSARRPAEPRHQRHRQRRAEPAADAEPDAHVGAAAHRRRDHDVHDLAVARGRRAHDRAGLGVRACARSRSGPGPRFISQWKSTGLLNAQIEETFTGPRGREGVRPPARGRAAVPRDQRRALRVVVRRAVHVEPDAAASRCSWATSST